MNELPKYGQRVLDYGYDLVPIAPGQKFPTEKGWTKKDYNQVWFDKAKLNGHKHHGIGIKGKSAPGLDLDISIRRIIEELVAYIEDEYFIDLIQRVGRPPRVLIPFRVNAPFSKLKSAKYRDASGNEHQVEWLANGQQYVWYGVHPGTGKPYSSDKELCPRDELPEVDLAMAKDIIAKFEEIAQREGWEVIGKGKESVEVGEFSDLENYKPPLDISKEKVQHVMSHLPVFEDYDSWFNVGCALHHQFEGSQEGLELWIEYSEQCSTFSVDEMEKKWPTIDDGYSGNKKTFASLIALAQEDKKQAFNNAVDKINSYKDGYDLLQDLSTIYVGFNAVETEQLAQLAKSRYKKITDTVLGISNFRVRERRTDIPKWCEPWVYVAEDNVFINIHNNTERSYQAFCLSFGQHVTPEEGNVAAYVLNNNFIKTVDRAMYLPGYDRFFTLEGVSYLNTYIGFSVPEQEYDQEVVDLFLAHVEGMIPNQRLREIFLSFLSFVTKNPKKRVNWSVLIQGQEGDGKGYFIDLFKAMFGNRNVKVASTSTVSSNFNTWAEGSLLTFLNEIRIVGKSRYEILDKIKPAITDANIEVHPKGKKERQVFNTASYITLTNHKDAVPINRNDRRFFIIFNQLGVKPHSYFVDLFEKTSANVYSIWKYLTEFEPHEEFSHKGRAPDSSFKQNVIGINRDDIEIAIEELIEDNEHQYICNEFISVGDLRNYLKYEADLNVNEAQLSKKLSALGWDYACRFSLDNERKSFRFKNKSYDKEQVKRLVKRRIYALGWDEDKF